MNTDSFFDKPIIKENQGLITLFITMSLAFKTIYYLYNRLHTQNPITTTTNTIRQETKVTKKRITINAKDILFENVDNIDISTFYTLLDKLSKSSDIYIIILIDENQDQNAILDKLNELYKDDIVKKHVDIFNLAYIIFK